MTAPELLMTCRQAGILLTAVGESIDVDAPIGAFTADLQAELVRLKPSLLPLLAAGGDDEMFPLHGGLTVPWPAARLALSLEDRGFTLRLDDRGDVTIAGPSDLTDADRQAIDRWRGDLAVIVAYDADTYLPNGIPGRDDV